MYVRVKPLDYSPLETDWETTLLGRKVELEWRLKVFLRTSNLLFWVSPHQDTLSCSQILKITLCMLSIMNEIDPWMSLPLWVLYGIQNQIFLQTSDPWLLPPQVVERGAYILLFGWWCAWNIYNKVLTYLHI